MNRKLIAFAFAVVVFNLGGFVFGGGNLAHAVCYNYFDPPEGPCLSPCEGSYPKTYCVGDGCTAGFCFPRGNSASCCGVEHTYAQIVPDPTEPPCDSGFCSLIRVRFLAKGKNKHGSPGLNSSLQPSYWSARPLPRILFEPNRCEHEYRAFFEEDFATSRKAGI